MKMHVDIYCELILANLSFLQETPHHVYLVMEVSGTFLSNIEDGEIKRYADKWVWIKHV